MQFIFVLPCHAIKIGLITGAQRLYLGASSDAQIIDVNTNKSIYTIDKMKVYEFRAYKKNGIALKVNDEYYNLSTHSVTLKPTENGFVSAKQKWYRGHFIITNLNGSLVLVNNLEIDDYIRGVVPAEMPSSWEYEAHKAQAIAARSYALANLGKRGSYGFDLKDTPEDQAYNGASAETLQTNKAVEETSGIVLIYDMKIIPAYYSASAGGKTASASSAWNHDLPYIRSVPSYDGNVKKNGHGVGMSQHGANNLAKKGYNAYQILQYFYKNIRFARINPDYYK